MVHAHPLSSSCESIAIRTSSWRSRRSFAQFSILQTEFKYPEMPSLKDTLQTPSVVSYNLLISGNAGAGRTEKAGSKEFVVVVVGVGVVVVVGSVGTEFVGFVASCFGGAAAGAGAVGAAGVAGAAAAAAAAAAVVVVVVVVEFVVGGGVVGAVPRANDDYPKAIEFMGVNFILASMISTQHDYQKRCRRTAITITTSAGVALGYHMRCGFVQRQQHHDCQCSST